MHQRDATKVAFAMVGLPARGKTYIGRKVARYLSWLGYRTRVFNVGNYRREHLGAHQRHEFFDPQNEEGRKALLEMAVAALDDTMRFFDEGGEVAIYDATNTTKARRKMVVDRCAAKRVPLVFIESICNDPAVIDANVRETKLRSPDYSGDPPEEAVRDFLARIAHYERVYEPIDDPDTSYIKIIDVGRQLVLNRIHGYLPARLAPLLMNMHITPRPIWLARHGESVFNLYGIIGGDAELTDRGRRFAEELAKFVRERVDPGDELAVWTSTLRRTVQTAAALGRRFRMWRALDEIDAGVCDGMTYAQVRAHLPEEYAARVSDKFRYRYPRGESYEDVIQRLEPLVIELERHRAPVLVIGHQAVLRALYAYLVDCPPEKCPALSIPLHTVIELTPTAYGCEERRTELGPKIDREASSA